MTTTTDSKRAKLAQRAAGTPFAFLYQEPKKPTRRTATKADAKPRDQGDQSYTARTLRCLKDL